MVDNNLRPLPFQFKFMRLSSQTNRKPKAVIVGAGTGGIVTAARLAVSGFEVVVVEKNDFTGGCCSLIHQDDHRFEQGPILVLMGKLYSSAYNDLGTSLEEEGVQLLKIDPNYKVHFGDGTSITMSPDHSLMKEEIEKWEGSSGYDRFLNYLKEGRINYEFTMEIFGREFPNLWSLLRPQFLSKFLCLPSYKSMYSRICELFKSDRVRQALTFQAMYLGTSPYSAPAGHSMLQYTEFTEGIYYPKGGFRKILEPLIKISEKNGAVYHLSCPVDKVIVSKEGRATGLKLSTGEEINADIVILNSDSVYSYRHLLPERPPSLLDRFLSGSLISNGLAETKTNVESRKRSTSCINFYWAMDRIIPEFVVNNIFIAKNYRKFFEDVFDSQLFSEDPCFCLNVTSRIDPTAAPDGKDTIVVLVPTGILKEGQKEHELEDLVERARNVVICTIEKQFGFKEFRKWIAYEIVDTPKDWEGKFNYDRGAILGLSHDLRNMMCFRPRIRHASIPNLFLVGQGTQPGAGIPSCFVSAKFVSEAILQDLNIIPPWKLQSTRKESFGMDHWPTSSFTGSYLRGTFLKWSFLLYLGILSIVTYFRRS